MHTNQTTAKWIGIIATIIIFLGFGTVGVIQNGTLKRVESNETDVRRIDKSQVLIIYQLTEINKKIDILLEKIR